MIKKMIVVKPHNIVQVLRGILTNSGFFVKNKTKTVKTLKYRGVALQKGVTDNLSVK